MALSQVSPLFLGQSVLPASTVLGPKTDYMGTNSWVGAGKTDPMGYYALFRNMDSGLLISEFFQEK